MTVTKPFVRLLESLRGFVYRTRTKQVLQRTGLGPVLKSTYWRFVSATTDDVSTIAVDDVTASFYTVDRIELEHVNRFDEGNDDLLRDIFANVRDDDVVWDVGANVGTFSCFIATRLGSGTVVPIEPHPSNAARIEDNLALNDIGATVYQYAMSNESGPVAFSPNGTDAGTQGGTIGGDGETIEVEAIRGDDLVATRDVPQPDVIKIDVEGVEHDVLKGLERTLTADGPRLIYCEVHPEKLQTFGSSHDELVAYLDGLGYAVTYVETAESTPQIRARKAE